MDWKDNINTVKEVFPGHFQIILDFATNGILKYILSESYKYVWIHNHSIKDRLNWMEYKIPLFNNTNYRTALVRNLSYDLILPTEEFRTLLPEFSNGIKLAQLNVLPPYYLEVNKIKGKARYDILKNECDYLFEIDIPGATDYGTLISSNKKWLEGLLSNEEINWNNLP